MPLIDFRTLEIEREILVVLTSSREPVGSRELAERIIHVFRANGARWAHERSLHSLRAEVHRVARKLADHKIVSRELTANGARWAMAVDSARVAQAFLVLARECPELLVSMRGSDRAARRNASRFGRREVFAVSPDE
ncbi:MAG: hypothetical protein M0R66_01145 [Candidatus Omnitrophica bacterium]|nr:hypothetical protein [Candidatus Omnitrophota bacterium]